MYIHKCHKRIRYGETDMMGYLYYGNYALLYEIGRSEAIRDLGVTYKMMEEDLHVMMPVVNVESRYMAPLKYDTNAVIETIMKELPDKMVTFEHNIYDDEGKKVHTATVKLFFVDMKNQKRTSCPQILRQKLKSYFD